MVIHVLRAGALGDAVLTLPFFRALRENFPDGEIYAAGSYPLLELLEGSPWADVLCRLEDPELSWLFSESPPPLKWRERFRTASFVFLLMEDERIFRKLDSLCSGRILPARGIGRKGHAADSILSVLDGAGITSMCNSSGIFLPEGDRGFAREFLQEKKLSCGNSAVIHPGSGSRSKNWPAEKFAEVGKRLVSDFGMKIIITAGEADEESAGEFFRHFGKGAVLARGLPLRRLGAVLAMCALYIGNDSGVSQLAAAAGAPCVCVFGPTDPGTWAPRGREVRIVRKKAPCSPCTRDERNSCPAKECLERVQPEDVLRQVGRILR